MDSRRAEHSLQDARPLSDEFVELLRCPHCSGRITRDSDDRMLSCEDCGSSFPIVGGIPRFVQQDHLASFGIQWNRFEVAHDDEDRATFQAKTGVRLSELKGLRVLDAGCGGGRYAKLAGEAGAEVFGVDHSTAVEKAARLCSQLSNVRLLQGDLKHLPFPDGTFDFAFSIGVMHHDECTRDVFDAVAKKVKPGGRLAVWLYRRNQWWQEAVNNFLRRRTTRMSSERLERAARWGATLGGVPVVRKTLNKVVNFSSHPIWENRVCDTYDWYAPRYQHHHTVEELRRWFEAAGYEDLVVLPPEKTGRFYHWAYEQNMLIGSGVNVLGTRRIVG